MNTGHELFRRHWLLLLGLGVLPFLLSCGYQVAGRGDRLPPDIKTIAVPIFVNQSSTFRIEEKLAAAISREFIERTKFRITPNPTGADAVLKGTVKDVRSGVITFDLSTGRASSLQIQVTADVKLEDLHTKKTKLRSTASPAMSPAPSSQKSWRTFSPRPGTYHSAWKVRFGAFLIEGPRAKSWLLCSMHNKLSLASYPESICKNGFPFWRDCHEN
jgi:hypothetical protein